MAKVLLSGGNGFVGSHVARAFARSNEVTLICKSMNHSRIGDIKDELRVISYDEYSTVEEEFDLFIHCATNYVKGANPRNLGTMINDNVEIPISIVRHFAQFGLANVINTGTCFEYNFDSEVVTEKSPKSAYNEYALTKIMFQAALESLGLNVTTLKLMTPYGPGDNLKLVRLIIEAHLRKERLELSEGFQRIDLIYISDVVSAYIKAAAMLLRRNNEIAEYLVGAGKTTSIRELVNLIERHTNTYGLVEYGAASVNDFHDMQISNARIKEELGWAPIISLESGIQATIRDYYDVGL